MKYRHETSENCAALPNDPVTLKWRDLRDVRPSKSNSMRLSALRCGSDEKSTVI